MPDVIHVYDDGLHTYIKSCTPTLRAVDFFSEENIYILLWVFHIHSCSFCSMYFTRCSHTFQCQELYVLFVECVEWEKIVSKNVSASAFAAPGVFFFYFSSPSLSLLVCICVSSLLLYTIRVCICVFASLSTILWRLLNVLSEAPATSAVRAFFFVHMHKFLCALNVWFSLFYYLFVLFYLFFLFFSVCV